MKKIATKSYVEAQQSQTVTFSPNRLKSPNQPQQSDPKIKTFQQAFTTLNVSAITGLSQSDAMILNTIQQQLRQKLRSFDVQVSF